MGVAVGRAEDTYCICVIKCHAYYCTDPDGETQTADALLFRPLLSHAVVFYRGNRMAQRQPTSSTAEQLLGLRPQLVN